jgi:hypothetical protein
MPQSSDDPPSAPLVESLDSDAPSANPPSASGEAAVEAASPPSPSRQEGELRRPRRRRRRRRPPPAPGSQSGAEAHTEQTASAGETAVVEDLPTAALGESELHKPPRRRRRRRRGLPREAGPQQAAASGDAQAEESVSVNDPPQSPAGDPAQSQRPQGLPHDNVPREHHPRRRHRQRRPPHERGPTDPKSGDEGGSASEGVGVAASRSGPSTNRRPGIGGPRIRRPREGEPREGERQAADSQERRPRNAGPRDPSGRTPGRRDQGARARGPRGTPSRDRNQERGREAQQRKPEQKLYALEAVVDRGFEDVTEEADESVTRRVHWTIIKRTVADQKTGKAMSAVYVLQREGVDSEYPNLGAARAAVNKTIVHPEKLTLSKAEHAAAKK